MDINLYVAERRLAELREQAIGAMSVPGLPGRLSGERRRAEPR